MPSTATPSPSSARTTTTRARWSAPTCRAPWASSCWMATAARPCALRTGRHAGPVHRPRAAAALSPAHPLERRRAGNRGPLRLRPAAGRDRPLPVRRGQPSRAGQGLRRPAHRARRRARRAFRPVGAQCQRVSVVGAFNGWDGRRHPMRLRHPAGSGAVRARLQAGECTSTSCSASTACCRSRPTPWPWPPSCRRPPARWSARRWTSTGRTRTGWTAASAARPTTARCRSTRCTSAPGARRAATTAACSTGTSWPNS